MGSTLIASDVSCIHAGHGRGFTKVTVARGIRVDPNRDGTGKTYVRVYAYVCNESPATRASSRDGRTEITDRERNGRNCPVLLGATR